MIDLPARATHRPVRMFVRHYVEMVLAMLLGMALYPLWAMAVSGADDSWLHRAEVSALAMSAAMSLPMAAWMAYRGHRPGLTVEMCLAMTAGFAVVFPLLWIGAIDGHGVMMAGHVLMPVFMLGAMLARWREYTHHG